MTLPDPAWLDHGEVVTPMSFPPYDAAMTTPPDQPYGHPGNPQPYQDGSATSNAGYLQGDGYSQGSSAGAVVPSPQPPVPAQQPYPPAPQPYPVYQQAYPQQAPSSGLYVAAAVINWVVLGLLTVSTFGLGLIAAAWMIPMTIMTRKGARDGYQHTALAVCTLLFCGLISGILMLVDEGNRRPRPF